MKIKQGFVLRNMDTMHLIAPTDSKQNEFQRIFSLNETGAFLWRMLENGADQGCLVEALMREYDVEETAAFDDVEEFLKKLQEMGVLEESK